MGRTQQVWKYSWNTIGYLEEEVPFSFLNYTLDKVIRLSHTYFVLDDFSAYYMYHSNKVMLKTAVEKKSDTDILFVNKDADLSSLAGRDVYSNVKLVSSRVLDKEVFITCRYIADALTFDSFKQELTPDSDVAFKSVEAPSISSTTGYIQDVEANSLHGSWGTLTESSLVLQGDIDSKNASLTSKGVILKDVEDEFKIGLETFNIKLNTKEGIAYLQTDIKKNNILFKGPSAIKDIPIYGIPVILPDDPTRLNFVPWLSLDVENKGIKVGSLNVDGRTLISGTTASFFKTDSECLLELLEYPFIEFNKVSGDVRIFNGVITINIYTKNVAINGVTFDNTFFMDIVHIKQDLNYLKSKITN